MKNIGRVVVILIILGLCAAVIVPSLSGTDNHKNHTHGKTYEITPLRIRRANGDVQTITLSDAMARHHGLEHHHHGYDHDAHEHHDHTGDVCIGVGVGYQALRYACETLFAEDIPAANDLEIKAVGDMRGTWDVFDLYTGKTLDRPKPSSAGMSLGNFTFTAKRRSSGKTITFRLRKDVIPKEFMDMKNRGLGCDSSRLRELKQQTVDTLLTRSPKECFEESAVTPS